MKYTVHVERLVRLRVYTFWVRGPYRFRWVALIVAWFETIDGENVCQRANITEGKS